MCDVTNSKAIVGELLGYLSIADYALREEMVLKIAILTEKFAVEHEWYVDTILRLMSTAGDHVGDEVWFRVVQIITNTEELQEVSHPERLNALKLTPLNSSVFCPQSIQLFGTPFVPRECGQSRSICPRRIWASYR